MKRFIKGFDPMTYESDETDLKDSADVKPVIKEKVSVNSVREQPEEEFKEVMDTLGIDEYFTKADNKQKVYNKFLSAVVPEPNFNYMSDLIELPTTKDKFKFLLVIVDLATNLFDIEPMTNKSSETTLQSFKNIIKRKILIMPEISLKTDGGTEFKSVFDKYLSDNGVWHKTAMPYRKRQMSPVEGLNGVIGRILMNYLNSKSTEIGKDYCEWTDILGKIRKEVNAYRKRDMNKLKKYQDTKYFDITQAGEPDYNIGDMVYYKLDKPTDILGQALSDDKHRYGDRIYSIATKEIVDILMYPSEPYYRYKLRGMPHASYSKYELKKSNKTETTYAVKKIIGMKVVNKKRQYLVWFKGELKANASWEGEAQLLEDGLEDYIDEFKKIYNKKKR